MKENSFETIRYIQTLNGTVGFEYRVKYGTKRETRCLPTDAPAQLLNLTYVAARENCFNLCRLASKTKQISVLCVTLHFHANVQFQVLSVSEFPYVRGRVRSSWSCR